MGLGLALLLLAVLAWNGIVEGLQQLPQSENAGQQAQSVAQLAYGLLSAASIITTVRARRWAPPVLSAWAVSVTVAAGLAPVVWGDSGWPAGVSAGGATLLVALGIAWLLRHGMGPPAATNSVGGGDATR